MQTDGTTYYLMLRAQASIYDLIIEWASDYSYENGCVATCQSGECSPNDWNNQTLPSSGTIRVKNTTTHGNHVYALTCTGPNGSTTATLKLMLKNYSWHTF
jgi:hypothetical protein